MRARVRAYMCACVHACMHVYACNLDIYSFKKRHSPYGHWSNTRSTVLRWRMCRLAKNSPRSLGLIGGAISCISNILTCNGALFPYVMHDVLEGVLQYEVKLLLKCLTREKKQFSLKFLNAKIKRLEVGYMEVASRPALIKMDSTDNLTKQKGIIHLRGGSRNVTGGGGGGQSCYCIRHEAQCRHLGVSGGPPPEFGALRVIL